MATYSMVPLAVLPLPPVGCTLNHYKNPSQIALKKSLLNRNMPTFCRDI